MVLVEKENYFLPSLCNIRLSVFFGMCVGYYGVEGMYGCWCVVCVLVSFGANENRIEQ